MHLASRANFLCRYSGRLGIIAAFKMSESHQSVYFKWTKEEDKDRNVYVACSANDWEWRKMTFNGTKGHHELTMPLPPGKHLYKYVIERGGDNPDWECDRGTEIATDSKNNENNIVEVKEPEQKQAASQLDTPPPPPLKPGIEVERKFSVPNHKYREDLEREGFEECEDMREVLSDFYYDDDEQSLMKADLWLRNRNGHWELKYPVSLQS